MFYSPTPKCVRHAFDGCSFVTGDKCYLSKPGDEAAYVRIEGFTPLGRNMGVLCHDLDTNEKYHVLLEFWLFREIGIDTPIRLFQSKAAAKYCSSEWMEYVLATQRTLRSDVLIYPRYFNPFE